jgi:signal transduction histidine kinase
MVPGVVHNGLRHSKASRIQVCLFDKNGKLHLLYSDNGVGFKADKHGYSNGLGLNSLKNRTEILAGKMKLQARPGKGVEYYFQFPL